MGDSAASTATVLMSAWFLAERKAPPDRGAFVTFAATSAASPIRGARVSATGTSIAKS